MSRLCLYRQLQAIDRPLVLAMGNFDGVHRGHQAILAAACKGALDLGFSPAALTFHPLPREYFAMLRDDPNLAPARLTSTTEKLAALQLAGMEAAFMPRFDARFAAQSPDAFIQQLRAMQVRRLLVGEDFRFGAGRSGDVTTLQKAGKVYGFTVEAMADIVDEGATRISSTAIRQALDSADLSTAQRLLGRPYAITGRVIHGKKLGRTLGFPTANISLTRRKPALSGVFAVRCKLVSRGLEGVAGGTAGEAVNTLQGVANLGTNPVVSSENRHHLEVFLFDFSGDLYGQRLQVEFIEKIRDEQAFPSLDALILQMQDDVTQAKNIFADRS
ncbi:MAG: bifunctional riboflavin kinase/FAD synthetase [Betaproteobacteria bacterium]|nr:bifunctional riboflavin kinase/FAD synthetase [Betaproteobacteria bacterium]